MLLLLFECCVMMTYIWATVLYSELSMGICTNDKNLSELASQNPYKPHQQMSSGKTKRLETKSEITPFRICTRIWKHQMQMKISKMCIKNAFF